MQSKLSLTSGVLSIVLGPLMAINTFIMLLFVIVCLAMPVLLPIWFLPMLLFVPIMLVIFLTSLSATVCNIVAGVGTVVTSFTGKKPSKVFSVASLAVDIAFIPTNIMFLLSGLSVNMGEGGTNWLGVLILVIAAVALALDLVGLVINSVCLSRVTKKPDNGKIIDT